MSGQNQRDAAGTGVTHTEPQQCGTTGTPSQTLLISVMVNTSSSVSAPLRCSRMAIRLDHGQAPGKRCMNSDMQARRGHCPPAGTSQEAGAALTSCLVHSIDSADEQQGVGLCVLHKHQEQLQCCLHHQAKLGKG